MNDVSTVAYPISMLLEKIMNQLKQKQKIFVVQILSMLLYEHECISELDESFVETSQLYLNQWMITENPNLLNNCLSFCLEEAHYEQLHHVLEKVCNKKKKKWNFLESSITKCIDEFDDFI